MRPPPAGLDLMTLFSGISSLNSSRSTFRSRPRSASSLVASLTVRPARDGTITFEPGPTITYQMPIPRAIAISAAIWRFRLTRLESAFLAIEELFSFFTAASWFLGISTSRSLSLRRRFAPSLFPTSFIASGGRSSSRLNCLLRGSNFSESSRSFSSITTASLGRLSGSMSVAERTS